MDLIRGVPNQFEPKRNNRFMLEFPQDLNIESWLVQTTTRPSYEANAVEIPFINTSTWVVGRFKWNTMDIEFIDNIGPSTSQKIMEWVRLHSESLTGRQGYAAGYKKDILLHALDPVGAGAETWKLVGCLITRADFGTNDHSNDEVQRVKITIQPDRCILSN